MKRIFLGLTVFLFLLIATVYAFIPGKLTVSSASSFKANQESVYRFLINDSNWQKWWPGTISKSSRGSLLFRYKDYDFQIGQIFYNVIQLKIGKDNNSSSSLLKIIPYSVDSIGVELSSDLNSRQDPISRISAYSRARKIKHVLDDIVLAIQKYTGNLRNIYGISINKEKVQYQYVLSEKKSFTHYPTTEDVYEIIERLRNYIGRSGAKELFWPMLNIKHTESIGYIAQVGIPVDRELPQKENITSKWMMKGGNILSGQVTGGPKQIDEAIKQMEMYIRDYQRSIIAIPFQMLITDRTKEPDSTKWITRIYYPVV